MVGHRKMLGFESLLFENYKFGQRKLTPSLSRRGSEVRILPASQNLGQSLLTSAERHLTLNQPKQGNYLILYRSIATYFKFSEKEKSSKII